MAHFHSSIMKMVHLHILKMVHFPSMHDPLACCSLLLNCFSFHHQKLCLGELEFVLMIDKGSSMHLKPVKTFWRWQQLWGSIGRPRIASFAPTKRRVELRPFLQGGGRPQVMDAESVDLALMLIEANPTITLRTLRADVMKTFPHKRTIFNPNHAQVITW